MAKRWSKLKSKVEALIVDKLPLKIHCSEIRTTRANDGSLPEALGIFTIRLKKEVIWNFPKQFVNYSTEYPDGGNHYSYSVSDLNALLREYLDTPKIDLIEKKFHKDYFGITSILKCADRRLGLKKLDSHFSKNDDAAIRSVLKARTALTFYGHLKGGKMKDYNYPILRDDTCHFPKNGEADKCPVCAEKIITADDERAFIHGGALLLEEESINGDQGIQRIDELQAFLFMDWESGSPDKYAELELARDIKKGQFSFTFCSTKCLRAFLNKCVDDLERKVNQEKSPS